MRRMLAGLLGLSLVGGCGPDGPKAAESRKVVADSSNPGAEWPLLLQHCLRSPGCDPMSNFGQGAGEASDLVEEISWSVQSADVVKEGGADYGASIRINLYATRGQGGAIGRPLTIDETVSNLRGVNARRSTLTIEYRTPGGAAPEPYSLALMSSQLRLQAPGAKVAKSQEALAEATFAFVDAMKWPDGKAGAKIEIAGKAGVVFSGYSWGIAAADIPTDREALARGFEPWVFYVPQNIRDEPVPALLEAIKAGETLSLKISAPDGAVMLSDAFYTAGYESALQQATDALSDPKLARPITQRCARFAKEPETFWKIADVTAGLRVCDPRTAEHRRRDAQSGGQPTGPVSSTPGQ